MTAVDTCETNKIKIKKRTELPYDLRGIQKVRSFGWGC